MDLKFYKMRHGSKLPHRAHSTDAGMDIFYCPDTSESNKCVWEPGHKFKIPAGENCLIPTGVKVDLPEGYMLEIKNKSGVAFKRQLLVGACVVDAGYDGEVFVNLHNIGTSTQTIEPGQKIAQAVLTPIVTCGIEEVREDRLNDNSSRQAGGFGSTGLQ